MQLTICPSINAPSADVVMTFVEAISSIRSMEASVGSQDAHIFQPHKINTFIYIKCDLTHLPGRGGGDKNRTNDYFHLFVKYRLRRLLKLKLTQ